MNRRELNEKLAQRAMQDEVFRQKLLKFPREAVEEVLGAKLPANAEVKAIEESGKLSYDIVLADPSSELSMEDLEQVAGGANRPVYNTGGKPKGDQPPPWQWWDMEDLDGEGSTDPNNPFGSGSGGTGLG
jgi:hypothetical protein